MGKLTPRLVYVARNVLHDFYYKIRNDAILEKKTDLEPF
jgi:hypothetical protein